MDGRRFDGLARAISVKHVSDRRGALRTAAAALLVGLGGRQASPLAAKDLIRKRRCKGKGKRKGVCCKRDHDCRNRVPDACVGAHCRGGTCAFFAVRCAAGYVCCGNASCCPA